MESICNSTYIHRNTHTHTINMIKYNFLLVYYLLLLASLSNEPINNICGFMKFTLTESFSSAEKNHLPLLVGEVFSIWGHIKIFQAIRFTWERRRVIVCCQFLRNEIQSCWLRVSCTASGPPSTSHSHPRSNTEARAISRAESFEQLQTTLWCLRKTSIPPLNTQ